MAQVKGIDMDDDGNPEWVTIKLSLKELAYLGTLTGKQSHITAEELMENGSHANDQLYDVAVGEVFNRWWDGGLEEFRRTCL